MARAATRNVQQATHGYPKEGRKARSRLGDRLRALVLVFIGSDSFTGHYNRHISNARRYLESLTQNLDAESSIPAELHHRFDMCWPKIGLRYAQVYEIESTG